LKFEGKKKPKNIQLKGKKIEDIFKEKRKKKFIFFALHMNNEGDGKPQTFFSIVVKYE
jgi:hypothetical protein